jgi:hypothetical protein
MSTDQPPITTPAPRDQSTGLMLFGILQIVLGGLCGLMGLMMVLITALPPVAQTPQGPVMNVRMMIPALIMYLVMAATFIWLGIGSIRARRWAWTLTVILSWIWLIIGAVSFIVFIVVAGPSMSAQMGQQAKIPPQVVVIIQLVTGVIMACIYILLPAMFLLFYHRASVRATCQRRDPQIRWTDRCPMPVLALSIILACSAASCLPSMLIYRGVMPLFGRFVSGPAGVVVILLIALLLVVLARGTYRLQMAAWWGTLLLWVVGTLNMAITFSRVNLMEMYEKIGMPAAQLEMMRKTGVVESMSRWAPAMSVVSGVVCLGYLLYVRRYFVRSGKGTIGEMPPAGEE